MTVAAAAAAEKWKRANGKRGKKLDCMGFSARKMKIHFQFQNIYDVVAMTFA